MKIRDRLAMATLVVAVAAAVAACAPPADPAVDETGSLPGRVDEAAGPTPAPRSDQPAPADAGDGAGTSRSIEVSSLDGDGCPDDTVGADHPDVVGARFEAVGDAPREYRVAVTLCSRYDTPQRYADAWRVVTPDGDVLGTRDLLHDHAGEQPFTRSLNGTLVVPDGVTTVVVEARDRVNGWGGATLELDLGS